MREEMPKLRFRIGCLILILGFAIGTPSQVCAQGFKQTIEKIKTKINTKIDPQYSYDRAYKELDSQIWDLLGKLAENRYKYGVDSAEAKSRNEPIYGKIQDLKDRQQRIYSESPEGKENSRVLAGFYLKMSGIDIPRSFTDELRIRNEMGAENVKNSLESGFSPKNLAVTAGMTVGVDLMKQVMQGEKPSPRKALKAITSARFAGSVLGSVFGAAAGSYFVPFLTGIPVVGVVMSALAPTFGSIIGSGLLSDMTADPKNPRVLQALKNIDWPGVAGQTIGSVAGSLLGGTLLGMVFPPLAPVGMILGGMVGGYVGYLGAHTIAGFFDKNKVPDDLSNTPRTSVMPVSNASSSVKSDANNDY